MAPPKRPSEAFNTHPQDDFTTSNLSKQAFDVIAIGSGWASRVALSRASAAGLTTLLIEDELIGGDCPFWACVPSKVLLRPQEALDTAAGINGAKEGLKDKLDVQAVFARRDMFTGGHSDAPVLIPMMRAAGITMVRGMGSLVGEKRVRITPSGGGDPITVEAGRAVVIGTGSVPAFPGSIKGLKEANVWEPRDATSSSTVPEHLIVLGAGAVGTEMAFAYRSFGSQVTLVSRREIIPSVDEEAGKIVREQFVALGGTVKLGSSASEVKREGSSITVTLDNGETITGSEVLLAAGRRPRTAELNLSAVGVKTDQKGFLPVDANLKVQGTIWLYAGGDVIGQGQLTHMAKYHGRIIANAILDNGNTDGVEWSATNATANIAAIPQVVFSHPPVASVGLTRKTAAAKGIKVREITAPFASLGGRIASDKTIDGWAQWLVDEQDRLVGATFVGFGADEQLHASTVAVVGGLTLQRLVHAIPSFPTLSEVYLGLIDAAGL